MKLSIVTSYYNCEKYIEEQFPSILSQTYDNWEWIIADDFSTDNTKQKLIELEKKDPRIRLVELSHKKQLWWNPQLFSSGDLVCHIDADDKILPKTFEKIVYYFKKFPEAVLIHFNSNKYKESLPQSEDQLFDSFVNNVYISKENKSFLDGFEKLGHKSGGIFGCLRVFKNLPSLKFKEYSDDADCSSNDGQWLLVMEEKGRTLTIPRTTYLVRERYDSENFTKWNIRGEVALMKDARERRKNIRLPDLRKIDYFDDIYHAAESSYLSPLNWEEDTKDVSFLNFNYSDSQKTKVADLFFEHNVSFDSYSADYYFVCINYFDSPQEVITIADNLPKESNVVFFCPNSHLQNNNRSGQNNLTKIQEHLQERPSLYFLHQENRSYFIIKGTKDAKDSMSNQLLSIYKNTKIKHIEPIRSSFKLSTNFIDGCMVSIDSKIDNDESEYLAEFINEETNEIIYSCPLKSKMWAKPNLKYFVKWKINIKEQGTNEIIKSQELDLKNKKVLINFDSRSIGDTIAWIPYVEKFRSKHDCVIFCQTFHNNFLKGLFPSIKFVPHSEVVDCYASYRLGWFGDWTDKNLNPDDPREVPLQQTASGILGLEHEEIRPRLDKKDRPRNIKEKYICISIASTAGLKHWQNESGWQQTVDYLNKLGYKVVVVQKEFLGWMDTPSLKNVIHPEATSLDEAASWVQHCEFFIGLGSGVSWLAWALNKKVILISGFSKEFAEFETPYRVQNLEVCNGCWNDTNHKFDKGDWNWCPKDKNFECSKNITFEMVKEKIDQILKI